MDADMEDWNVHAIEDASEKGDIATLVRILIDEKRSLNEIYPESHKLLIEALQRGYFDIAALFISQGAPVNCVSVAGWTPLHIAAGDPAAYEVIKMMLDRGADVNAEISVNTLTDFLSEEAGDTPLHRACINGNFDIVTLLLEYGADCNKTNTHITPPLIIAVKGKWTNTTRLLLEHGADVRQYNINPPSLWCLTPLDWAMSQLFTVLGSDNLYKVVHHLLSWEPEKIVEAVRIIPTQVDGLSLIETDELNRLLTIIELLVSKGASDNVIIQAMKFCSPEEAYKVAEILIALGVSMDVSDQRGISLMQVAACIGHYDLIKLFLDNGAASDRPNNCGWTPLMISLAGFKEIDLNVVKLFIEYGADVNAEDEKGKTPLMIAIAGYFSSNNHARIVEYLLDQGALVNVADSEGDTPLSKALKYRKRDDNDDIIKLLLDRGANVNSTNAEGNAPLHIAISKYDRIGVSAIKLLLDHGAEIDARDADGNTPLMLAITCCYVSNIAQLLIERGADVNTRNLSGHTPFQLAVTESRTDVLAQLLINKVDFEPKELLEDESLVRLVLGAVAYRKKEVLGIHRAGHRRDIKIARRQLVNFFLQNRFAERDQDFRGRAFIALYEHLRNSSTEIQCTTGLGSTTLLFTLVEKRLLSMKLRRERVSCHHLKSVLSYRYTVKDDMKTSYNNVCNKEIRRLNQYKISEDVTLLDFLSKNPTQRAIYARSQDICPKLLDTYNRNNRGLHDPVPFPIFATLINDSIQNAVGRKKLLEAGEYCLNSLLLRNIPLEKQLKRDNINEVHRSASLNGGLKLPIVISDAILGLLSDEDLQYMIAAYCGIKSGEIKQLHADWKDDLLTLIFNPHEL